MAIIKTVLLMGLLAIFFQDLRERRVYWYLFPVVAVSFGALHVFEAGIYQWAIHILINLSVVGLIVGVIAAYANLILKRPLLETFGAGDVLMLLALAFSFASGTFLILLGFSLLFSLTLYLLIQKRGPFDTVPLAGNMSVFYCGVLTASWSGLYDNLYFF